MRLVNDSELESAGSAGPGRRAESESIAIRVRVHGRSHESESGILSQCHRDWHGHDSHESWPVAPGDAGRPSQPLSLVTQ